MTQVQKKTTLKPIGDRVILQKKISEEPLKGGIILPDSAKEKPQTAQVIAVGEGKKAKDGKLIEMPVKVGNIVLTDKYSGQEVNLDDEEYIIVKADDIIAVIEN